MDYETLRVRVCECDYASLLPPYEGSPRVSFEPHELHVIRSKPSMQNTPSHASESSKSFLICHGLGGSSQTPLLQKVASALRRTYPHHAVVLFDYTTSKAGKTPNAAYSFSSYAREVSEIRAVVRHCRDAGEPVEAILGYSKSGTNMILYNGIYHDIPYVVNISGRFNMAATLLNAEKMKEIEEKGQVELHSGKPDSLVYMSDVIERKTINMEQHARQIEADVLTTHGTADVVISVQDAHDIARVVPRHTLKIFEDCPHTYEGHTSAFLQTILEWLSTRISPPLKTPQH